MRALAGLFLTATVAGAGEETMKTGEFWYRMEDPGGAPQGYARMEISAREDGGIAVVWELHLAFPGGTYEEARTMEIDGAGALLAATYTTEGNEVSAHREDGRLRGTQRRGGKEAVIDLETPAPAITGMGFVLACRLSFEEGADLAVADFNESAGFADAGTTTFVVKGRETVSLPSGEVAAWKVAMRRADGTELPVWVGEDRAVLQVDWGGGNLMVFSREPTKDLFHPPPPAFVEADESSAEWLALVGDFEGFKPEEMFDHWTRPELLVRWWPQKAEVGDAVGGPYHAIWEQPVWFMRGTLTAYARGKRLGFTWRWDHMPDKPQLEVTVAFEAVEGGTRLLLTQGPYADTEADCEERAGHLRGWLFFGAKLRAERP